MFIISMIFFEGIYYRLSFFNNEVFMIKLIAVCFDIKAVLLPF